MCDKTFPTDTPPQPPAELYARSPMKDYLKKLFAEGVPYIGKKRESKEMEFIEDIMR